MKDQKRWPPFLLLVSAFLSIGSVRIGAPVRLTAPTEWIKTFQPDIGAYRYGWDVKQTLDGGYITAGSVHYWIVVYPGYYKTIRSHIYLFRTDGTGRLLWQKVYVNPGDEDAFSVLPAADGGFILTGYTTSFGAGGGDVYLIKTDGSGNVLWQKTFGGPLNDAASCILQTYDGGFIIGGVWSEASFEDGGPCILRTDRSGILLWQKVFKTDNFPTLISAVEQTYEGGFIATGSDTGYDDTGPGHWGVPLYKLGIEESFHEKRTLPREIRR